LWGKKKTDNRMTIRCQWPLQDLILRLLAWTVPTEYASRQEPKADVAKPSAPQAPPGWKAGPIDLIEKGKIE